MPQDNNLRYNHKQQNYGLNYNLLSAVLHHTFTISKFFLSQKSGKSYQEPIYSKLQVVLKKKKSLANSISVNELYKPIIPTTAGSFRKTRNMDTLSKKRSLQKRIRENQSLFSLS